MRSTRIKAEDIFNRRVGGPCESRWFTPEFEQVVEDIYERNGDVTIGDLLDGKTRAQIPGRDGTEPDTVEDVCDCIITILDPALVGDKVFKLLMADIAELQLEDFEASEYNNPAPRAMVEGLRALAFGKITLEEFKVLQDEAYGEGRGNEENNRADVSYLGRIATLPSPSKEFTDWTGEMDIKLREKSLAHVTKIQDRMKEFDRGAVDLKDEVTARPIRARR